MLDAAVLGEAALEWVRDGGVYVGVRPGAAPAAVRGVRTTFVGVTADGARLAEPAGLVDGGALTLRVADTYALEESAKAHARLAGGGAGRGGGGGGGGGRWSVEYGGRGGRSTV